MKKTFRLLSLFLVVTFVLGCFAGCGSKKKSGKVTIIVPDLILNPIGADVYTAQLQDEFDAKYGDEIEVKHILPTTSSDVNDVQNISTVLLGNDAPAYVGVSSTVYMKDLYNMGLIRDISDFVKGNKAFNSCLPSAIDACKYSDGSIIGYPNGIEIPMMGFYTENLKKAGYNPDTFTCETWDDYYNVAKKMTTGSTKGASIYASEYFLWPHNWFNSNGAQLVKQGKDGKISLNYTDDKVVETVNFLKKLYSEGLTNEDIGYTDVDSMFSLIYNKDIASFTMYPTWISRFTSAGVYPSEITLCKYPKGPSDGYQNVMYVSAKIFNASLSDEELEAAIKYVSFMSSKEALEGKYNYFKENHISQLSIPTVKDVDWWSCLTDFPEQWITSVKDAVSTAKDISVDSTGFTTYFSAALPNIITGKTPDVKKGLEAAATTTKKEWLNNYNKDKK